MKSQALIVFHSSSTDSDLLPHGVKKQFRLHGWDWRSIGAGGGLCIGILSPLLAAAVTIIIWITHSAWHGTFLHYAANVLFLLTLPLLILGAHCLDLMDRQAEKVNELRHKQETGEHQ